MMLLLIETLNPLDFSNYDREIFSGGRITGGGDSSARGDTHFECGECLVVFVSREYHPITPSAPSVPHCNCTGTQHLLISGNKTEQLKGHL